jgi:uncharacterized DUF497 family protein
MLLGLPTPCHRLPQAYKNSGNRTKLTPGVAKLATPPSSGTIFPPIAPANIPNLETRDLTVYNRMTRFEWDADKAKLNFAKHRISFEEATTAFRDPLSVTAADPDHSMSENRLVTFGMSSKGILLKISHTERGESIRIISARNATKQETRIYEEEN